MKKTLISMAIAVSFLAACSSAPDRNSQLEQARSSFQTAQNNTQVRAMAPEEMVQAEAALRTAEAAWSNKGARADVDHLAYLSIQRTAIAQQSAAARASQAVTASASAERDRMLLQARTSQVAAGQRELTLAQQNAARAEAERAAAQRSSAQSASQLAAANAAAAASAQREQDRTASANARIAEMEAQLRELNARPTPRGLVVTLGDVLFNTGQSQLLAGANANMQRLAEFMRANPGQNATIEGHTDSVGSAASNYSLSQRRADSVKTELVKLGVQSDRLTTRAFGQDNPIAGNDTATGRQMNRRVEIVFPE
jgi:outer membrane protein OmpA-like peptidoglycan-associated protein